MRHYGAGILRATESSKIPPLPPIADDRGANTQYVLLERRIGSDSAATEYLWSAAPELQASGTGADQCNGDVWIYYNFQEEIILLTGMSS